MNEPQNQTEAACGGSALTAELEGLTGDDAYTKLRHHWIESEKREKDWREAGEVKLLEQMHDAVQGLKACGWREIEYCPKDGTRFLAICAGSTGVHPHYYSGEWPNGSWWAEASGDLWPSRPALWKPMPSNARLSGPQQREEDHE